jgi:hypothetical protein
MCELCVLGGWPEGECFWSEKNKNEESIMIDSIMIHDDAAANDLLASERLDLLWEYVCDFYSTPRQTYARFVFGV